MLLLVGAAAATGCVRRRLLIRSSPPGALAYVDNQQIGVTPVSTGFTYYGTRTVTLVKDGYETMTVKHNFDAPWYQVPPLDFVSENLVPQEIRDERVLDFTLVPQRLAPAEETLQNAENLRRSALQGYVVPLQGGPAAGPASGDPFIGRPPAGAPFPNVGPPAGPVLAPPQGIERVPPPVGNPAPPAGSIFPLPPPPTSSRQPAPATAPSPPLGEIPPAASGASASTKTRSIATKSSDVPFLYPMVPAVLARRPVGFFEVGGDCLIRQVHPRPCPEIHCLSSASRVGMRLIMAM